MKDSIMKLWYSVIGFNCSDIFEPVVSSCNFCTYVVVEIPNVSLIRGSATMIMFDSVVEYCIKLQMKPVSLPLACMNIATENSPKE